MKGSFFAEAGMQTLISAAVHGPCWPLGLPLAHLSPQARVPSLVRHGGEGGEGHAARDEDLGRQICTQTLTPLLLRRVTNSAFLATEKMFIKSQTHGCELLMNANYYK